MVWNPTEDNRFPTVDWIRIVLSDLCTLYSSTLNPFRDSSLDIESEKMMKLVYFLRRIRLTASVMA